MREMWVDPKYFNRRSFGCFEAPKDMIPGVDDILNAMPVVVMTREEVEEVKKLINDATYSMSFISPEIEKALEILEGGGN